MSRQGDRTVLLRRRQQITPTAPACPVCGRPVVARGMVINRAEARWIRQPACSTTCLEALRLRASKEPKP